MSFTVVHLTLCGALCGTIRCTQVCPCGPLGDQQCVLFVPSLLLLSVVSVVSAVGAFSYSYIHLITSS